MSAAGLQSRLLARNTVLNILGQLLPLAVAVLTVPAIIRGLGAPRFGVLTLAWILLGYFGLFDLGMGRAATKFVAEALGRGERERVPALAWSAALIQTGFGLVGGLVLAALTPLLVHHVLTIPEDLRGEATVCFYLLAASVPVVLVSSSLRGVLEAAQRFDLINAVKVPSSAANYLLPLAGIALGAALPTVMAILLAGRLASTVAFGLLCTRVFPGFGRRATLDRGALRQLLGFGGWITVSAVTGPILTYIEQFLIASLLSVGALAFYSAPFEMVSRASIFPASVALTLFPAFSYLQARQSERIGELVSRPLGYLLAATTPVLVLFVAFAPEILTLWLGGEFPARSTGTLRILAVAFFINALVHVPFSAVQGLGRPDLKAKLDLIEVPLFLLLGWLLIPRFGVAGAALAKLGVTIVDAVGLFWLAARLGAGTPGQLASSRLPGAAAASAAYVALALAFGALAELPLGVEMFAAALLTAAYAAVVWSLVFDARDRSLILEFRPGRRRREAGVGA